MASDYSMIIAPAKGQGGKVLAQIQCRHIKDVPGPGDEEPVWDTTLDPKAYEDNVTVAADIAKYVHQGRRYEAAREAVVSNLGDVADIILDLKAGTPGISESSRDGLYEVALSRLQSIGKAFGIDL